MAGKKVVRTKRKVSKNIEAGVAHIRSTFNNTIVTISDLNGAVLGFCRRPGLPWFSEKHSFCSSDGC